MLKCLFYVAVAAALSVCSAEETGSSHMVSWLLNAPADFHNRSSHLGDGLIDVRNDSNQMKEYTKIVDHYLPRVDGFTDGEVVDALEHFFWGQKHGLAIELGALDGSTNTRSQTYEYEKALGWRRILVEGDPSYKANLLKHCPEAFVVTAAICSNHGHVHFNDQSYTGGILEFMSTEFFRNYHAKIFNSGVPPGNISSINWKEHPQVQELDCIPMSAVLSKARARHVNYFILDVEVLYLLICIICLVGALYFELLRFFFLCLYPQEQRCASRMIQCLTTCNNYLLHTYRGPRWRC